MKNLIIGFSTSNRCLARLIRWMTRSSVSHVYICIPVTKHSVNLIFQASGLAVNMESSVNFMEHSKIVREIAVPLSLEQEEELMAFVFDTLGKPYSLLQLVGMIWVIGCKSVGLRVKNPFRDGDHSYICVELVAKLLKLKGAEEMTPQDLLEWCDANLGH